MAQVNEQTINFGVAVGALFFNDLSSEFVAVLDLAERWPSWSGIRIYYAMLVVGNYHFLGSCGLLLFL